MNVTVEMLWNVWYNGVNALDSGGERNDTKSKSERECKYDR